MNDNKLKSLKEIINKNLNGFWCDGVILIEIEEGTMTIIDNINDIHRSDNLVGLQLYPIAFDTETFSKVEKMPYKDAVNQLMYNNKIIISPRVVHDDCKTITCGGNIFEKVEHGCSIKVNDGNEFDSMDYLVSIDYITNNEIRGTWMVF